MNFIQIDNYIINIACIEAIYLEKRTIFIYTIDNDDFYQVTFDTNTKAESYYTILANKLTNANENINA